MTAEEELRRAVDEARSAAAGGVPFHTCAETLFENAVTPLSKVRTEPLDAVQTALVGEVVSTMLDLGRRLFQADPYAARKLAEILRWAKHLAGPQGDEATWHDMFESLERDWNWQGR